ncbi:hypothetical protein CEXT_325661 [Caerostris extrusa]|uniref:Uncharacterized protein n=1 Tax=Caerostris extrusa TaxID=172846 RepID=A0AAV4WQR4_CAEEX|nr:hypothetical protein CEXT_325661 [Caerostris extrusa]
MSLIESSSLSSATKTAKNKTRRRMHWNGTLQSHNELQAISSPDKRVLSSGVHVCRLAARAFFLTANTSFLFMSHQPSRFRSFIRQLNSLRSFLLNASIHYRPPMSPTPFSNGKMFVGTEVKRSEQKEKELKVGEEHGVFLH